MNDYDWLNKKTPRSVLHLRLWPLNPRLNPEENHLYVSDFVEDFTSSERDKISFFDLVKSIVNDGFRPYDPIIVWKHKDKYYVAEGNRRVLALKLLLEPLKAPKSIRSFFIKQSHYVKNREDLEKIMVNVSPSFEEAEWYINQRNSGSTLQRKWTRVQQLSWIAELYEKYNGDLDLIQSKIRLPQSELDRTIRLFKLRDLVKEKEVRESISDDEFNKINSYRFPISTLEKFFDLKIVKESWGIVFKGMEFEIESNVKSFHFAFASLLKGIIETDREVSINTRTISNENITKVLESLPQVNLNPSDTQDSDANSSDLDEPEDDSTPTPSPPAFDRNEYYNRLKKNPNRRNMVLKIYTLKNGSYKLVKLFEELKIIPFSRYKSCIAGALRIFLDLCVLNFIEVEQLEQELKRTYNSDLKYITLSKRLEYLKRNNFNAGSNEYKVIVKLLNSSNDYSLDVLNGYMHSDDTHFLSKQFLNGFWDFMFPLINKLVDIRETKF